MANITRVKPGGWAIKEVYTSAQKNQTDERWLRCLVNDGQSDLLANASIHGGTTKSFGFAGLTTFGVTTSGAQSYSGASHAIATSGAVTVGADTYALTTSGDASIGCTAYTLTASGAVTVNADDYTLDADGNAVLDAGLDFTIAAGQDLLFSPAGTWGGAAAKALFSGADWPALGSRTVTDWAVPHASYVDIIGGAHSFSYTLGVYTQAASAGAIKFTLHIPVGFVVNSVLVRYRSIVPSLSFPPSIRPNAKLESVNQTTGVSTLLASATDASANAAAYNTFQDLACIPAAPHTVAAGTRLVLSLFGATDASPSNYIVAIPPVANVTITSMRFV